MSGMTVSMRGVTKRFLSEKGRTVHALDMIDLEAGRGEFLCVLGPTGCGKSTLLRLIAGLETPDAGTIFVDGEHPVPGSGTGFAFQQPALFPWLTVRGNVEFGLRRCTRRRKARREIVEGLLTAVGLQGFADAFPHELSGGMQQRAALVRSLAPSPGLMLLDEPLSSLDTSTRDDLQDLILDLCRGRGITTVFVTHNIEEAVYLGDRLVVLGHRPGRIVSDFRIDIPHPRDRLSVSFVSCLLRVRTVFEGLVSEARRVPDHSMPAPGS